MLSIFRELNSKVKVTGRSKVKLTFSVISRSVFGQVKKKKKKKNGMQFKSLAIPTCNFCDNVPSGLAMRQVLRTTFGQRSNLRLLPYIGDFWGREKRVTGSPGP